MLNVNEVETWTGHDVIGPDGEKIGSLDHLYVDRETGEPTFIAVKTGLFGMSDSLVPVPTTANAADGKVSVAYDKAKVKGAPNVKADGELSEQEEAKLYEYYGLGGYSQYDGPDHATLTGGHTDDAMTRSEEELRVGTTRQESGRARLRKYVVTENETRTVPVQREEVVIEREPIAGADAGAALDGPEISEAEHEVTLHEDRVVTEKTVVPKERVRMDVETTTDEVRVDEEVRKERIEADGDTGRPA